MSTQRKEYSLQDDIGFLIRIRNMTLEGAIDEMERVWKTKFSQELKDLLYTDERFYKWGGNGS